MDRYDFARVVLALVLLVFGVTALLSGLDARFPQEQVTFSEDIGETWDMHRSEHGEVNEDSLMRFYVDPSQPPIPHKLITDADLCFTNYYPQTVFKNGEGCLKWLSTICRHPDDRCIVSEILTPADIKKEIRE